MSSITILTQVASISTALVASGGIAALSLFDVPELQSQPASRSLPMTRWLFSRGSHIFPQAAVLSSAGFFYLALSALPPARRGLLQLVRVTSNGSKPNGYLIAAALAISIGPFTQLMIPTNFALIKMNEDKGGARSSRSKIEGTSGPGSRSADDSVAGKGEAPQFTDLSGPQGETDEKSTAEEDKKVRELLGKFSALNAARAVLLGAGGIAGLVTALL